MNVNEPKKLKVIEGGREGRRLRIGIVVSRFNGEVTQQLLSGAVDALRENGVKDQDIEIARVPGAFEIPLVTQRMAKTGHFQGVIALGAVIRGETPHFEYICTSVSAGLSRVALETGIPIGFGVLTTDTIQQAMDRASTAKYNRGAQAALTVLEMVNLLPNLK
jgi:6,7-dimethyl-8-ribityllumazine synthase